MLNLYNFFHKGTIPMAIPMERVENRILSIRGRRVMLDADLAELCGVTVGRGIHRFEIAICDLKARTRRPYRLTYV